jgi:hypothetical protein
VCVCVCVCVSAAENGETGSNDRNLVPKVILLAISDVEANYLIVRAYQVGVCVCGCVCVCVSSPASVMR